MASPYLLHIESVGYGEECLTFFMRRSCRSWPDKTLQPRAERRWARPDAKCQPFPGLNIRLEFLHEVVFYILYGMSVIVTFVAIERIIFFSLARGHALRLERALKPGVHSFDEVPKGF